jgi:pilus assembly protein Flp/PilA
MRGRPTAAQADVASQSIQFVQCGGFSIEMYFVDVRETASNRLEDAMKSFASKVQRFLVSEDGPTAVEYAVMLALIIIVCLTAINSIGTNANTTFESVATELAP